MLCPPSCRQRTTVSVAADLVKVVLNGAVAVRPFNRGRRSVWLRCRESLQHGSETKRRSPDDNAVPTSTYVRAAKRQGRLHEDGRVAQRRQRRQNRVFKNKALARAMGQAAAIDGGVRDLRDASSKVNNGSRSHVPQQPPLAPPPFHPPTSPGWQWPCRPCR